MKYIQTTLRASRTGLVVAIVAVLSSVMLLSAPKASAASCNDYVYRQGGNGTCVRYIQMMLNDMAAGSSIAEDGDFGPITKSKVIQFQKLERIYADGIVGRVTWSRLCNPQYTYVESANYSGWLRVREAAGC